MYSALKKIIPRRFQNRMPKRQKLFTIQDRAKQYNPVQALSLMRTHSFTSFIQGVDVCIKLGVNPKNGQQIVRGTTKMPAGLGKKIKVGVLCSHEEWIKLQQSQFKPDIWVDDAVIKQIPKGNIEFQKLFTTTEHLNKLKPYGKILGPKGLMPNVKVGTLVTSSKLLQSVSEAKQGQFTYRVDSGKNLHALIGKTSFKDDELLINFQYLMQSLVDKRPAMIKGKYFLQAYLKSTMGPRWKLQIHTIDPRSSRNIWQYLNENKQQQFQNKIENNN